MCGGDDHLAWKRPVSSEACRGLHTTGGSIDTFDLGSASWIRVRGRLIRLSDPGSHDMDSLWLQLIIVRLPHRHGGCSDSEDTHARMDSLSVR
ncbi:hypothetical protein AAG906_000941 [Vitis piasezkii]